ncbi:MAG: hypothetical protein M0029_02630 [Actinomycetota bacterium]|nr:hypothetical protein [Actinomycetota bacterium]
MKRRLSAAAVAAVIALALVDSGTSLKTWQARVTYAGSAIAVVTVASTVRRRRRLATSMPGPSGRPKDEGARDPSDGRGLALWLGVVGVAATWDVLALLTPPDRHHLTLSALTLAYRAFHVVVFAFWVAIGGVLVAAPLRRRGAP